MFLKMLYQMFHNFKNFKSFQILDEQSDVTVKCETLDGGQFFADTCSPPPVDGRDIHFSRVNLVYF